MKLNITHSLLALATVAGLVVNAQADFAGLGYYTNVSPNSNNETPYNTAYNNFKAAMGQEGYVTDIFIDFGLPIVDPLPNSATHVHNDWSSNASFFAGALAAASRGTAVTPVVSVGLTDGPHNNETAMLSQMADISNGVYDATWTSIVTSFKAKGFTKIYLRLGWEHDLGAFPWYATRNATDAAAFVSSFRKVAQVAKAVPGITVKVVWCPADINWVAYAVPNTWPGDDVVDVVGPDCYNACWPEDLTNWSVVPPIPPHSPLQAGDYANVAAWAAVDGNRVHFWDYPNATQWNHTSTGGWGLLAGIAFAKAHNKSFALSETGSGVLNTNQGPLDDGAFPRYLADRLSAAVAQGVPIEYAVVWDCNVGDGHWKFDDGTKPATLAGWQYFVNTMAALTGGMTDSDIGTVGLAGSGATSGGMATVKGAGTGFWTTQDSFNFYRKSAAVTGTQTIIARVTGLTNTGANASAGLMFRGTTAANSAYAMISTSPTGQLLYSFRTADGASPGSPASLNSGITPSASTPVWLKLVKNGSGITGYYGTGVTTPATWIYVGAASFTLPANFYAGEAVHSHNSSALATGLFDNLSP